MVFRPGRGTLDQLYTLSRVLEGSWEFAQPIHMCFVDLEKAFNCVPRGILWRVLREYKRKKMDEWMGSVCVYLYIHNKYTQHTHIYITVCKQKPLFRMRLIMINPLTAVNYFNLMHFDSLSPNYIHTGALEAKLIRI